MLTIEVREVPIRLSVPIRKCDGCGAIDETATTVLRRDADQYTAEPELPKGWNTLAVGSHALDLCDRCSAAAVLERRQATKPAEVTATTPTTAPTIVDAILGPETPTVEVQAPPPNGGTDRKNKTAAKEA